VKDRYIDRYGIGYPHRCGGLNAAAMVEPFK